MVLVGITHAGNIGSIARVMKNMGLRNLILVSSTDCGPDTDAEPMSSGAYDIVAGAARMSDPAEALEDSVMVVGTSGRLGGKRITAQTPAGLIPRIMEQALVGPVSIVFGRESRGLTNAELAMCTHHLIVPTEASFASMNVAHCAAVVGYELFKAASEPVGFQARQTRPAAAGIKEEMYSHIEEVLTRCGFLDPSNPLLMMRDIRRIFNSADMDDRDVKIVRGIFRKVGTMKKIADDQVARLEKQLRGRSNA